MEENIKDFGKWVVPESWSDITLKQFQNIENELSGETSDVRSMLHILCNKTRDEVNELPIEFAEQLLSKLSFLTQAPDFGKPSPGITIDGERYEVNVMEKLKTGEYVAVSTALKADKRNYAAFLAILCRKENEVYDSKFEAEKFDERVKMFEQQPITKIMPIISFFLNLWLMLSGPSQLSLTVKEELNRIANELENSDKIGALKKWFMMRRVKKLAKSL